MVRRQIASRSIWVKERLTLRQPQGPHGQVDTHKTSSRSCQPSIGNDQHTLRELFEHAESRKTSVKHTKPPSTAMPAKPGNTSKTSHVATPVVNSDLGQQQRQSCQNSRVEIDWRSHRYFRISDFVRRNSCRSQLNHLRISMTNGFLPRDISPPLSATPLRPSRVAFAPTAVGRRIRSSNRRALKVTNTFCKLTSELHVGREAWTCSLRKLQRNQGEHQDATNPRVLAAR